LQFKTSKKEKLLVAREIANFCVWLFYVINFSFAWVVLEHLEFRSYVKIDTISPEQYILFINNMYYIIIFLIEFYILIYKSYKIGLILIGKKNCEFNRIKKIINLR